MNPAVALRSILGPTTPTVSSAVISSVAGSTVYVIESGQTRVANVISGDATVYRPGDTVRVQGSVVIGKVSPRKSKVVYV